MANTIKADNWEMFIGWFPEIAERLHKNVSFTRIEMTMENGDVFVYEKSTYKPPVEDDIKMLATYDWPDSSRPLSDWTDEQLFAAGKIARKKLGGK